MFEGMELSQVSGISEQIKKTLLTMRIVFLRHLEYYSGILFLTTNRINSIDPAFQSRIQEAIEFGELIQPQRQRIWKSLLDSLLVNLTEDDRYRLEQELPSLSKHELNGRQIRNVINVASLLAADDGIGNDKVELKHIKEALRDTLEFQQFFDEGKQNLSNKGRVWRPFAPSQDTFAL
jgi:AAA+ superfamily predicted ATPase